MDRDRVDVRHFRGGTHESGARREPHAALDLALRRVAARASSLWEREPWGDLAPSMGTAARTIQRRLSRWREVASQGHSDRFRRRLEWDGLTEHVARRLLAEVDPSAIVQLPDWTRTLRAIVESAQSVEPAPLGDVPVRDLRDANDPVPFEEALIPAVVAARKLLVARNSGLILYGGAGCVGMLSDHAYRQIERSVLTRLSSVAEATLDAEFCARRSFGATLLLRYGVKPASPRVRTHYDAFVHELLADGLLSLFVKYPVLARLLAVIVDLWVDTTSEFLRRLDADRLAIAILVGRRSADALGPVTKIACDLGDAHRGGRTVMSLTFACGATVMYKPKPVGLEVAYTGLLRWINRRRTMLPLRAQRVLDRGDYGWVEYVEAGPCADENAMRRFYRRAGMLQSLLYAIGATDCHTENLVASGEQLVLVDMETLVQPRVTPVGDDEGHLDSVLQTGLLPQWECQHDTRHAIDVSGLGVGGAESTPQRRWRFVNTDAMHLTWSIEPGSPLGNASPLGGRFAPLDGFEDEFVNGFEQMYRFLVRYRRVLLTPDGPLSAFRGREARLLFRATQTYERIAEAAFRPKRLRSGVDWSIELDHLAFAFLGAVRKPIAWPILHAELHAMESLDVPYFASITSESTLLGLDSQLRGYLRCSGYDDTVARLARLGEADLALQCAIIRGALHACVAEPHATASPPPERIAGAHAIRARARGGEARERRSHVAEPLIEEAVAIGRLLSERVIALSAERINWLGLTYIRNNERLQVSLLSPNLYDGVCGIAVFLAALSRVTGTTAFGELALRALKPVQQAIRGRGGESAGRLVEQLGLGGALGIGSVLYAFCKVGAFLNDASLLDDALQAARAISPKHVRGDAQFDVMAGSAGAILGLLALHGLTHEPVPLRRAVACGHHLTNAQIPRGPHAGSWQPHGDHATRSGFAHGASGVAVALLRLYANTGHAALRRAAKRALAFERTVLSVGAIQRRASEGNEARDRAALAGWCHGPPGIGLACLSALAVIDSAALRGDAALALTRTRREGTSGLDHLCCGSMGRTETLLAGAAVLGDRRLERIAQVQGAEVVARARVNGGYRLRNTRSSDVTLQNPALFQGLSGIGYQLLRLARPDVVPSLLLFH
jgi:type 2 lantibiotic biosynthesis protein LanM